MKKVSAFLFMIMLSGLFFANEVQAIEIEHTCRYADSSQNNVVYIFMYDNGDVESYVKKSNGKMENGHQKYGNSEGVPLNWDDLENQDSCPKYTSFKDSGLFGGYSINVGNSRNELSSYDGMILPLSDYSSLATCTYNVTISDGSKKEIVLGIQPEEGFITYTPLAFSMGGDEFGPLGGINYFLDGYYEKIYLNGTLSPQCPSLYFYEEINSNIYTFGTSSVCASSNDTGIAVKGTFKNTSDTSEKEDQSRDVCKKYITDKIRNQMTVVFSYDVDGNKVFSIYRNNNTNQGSTNIPYDGVSNSINGVVFSIDPNYYDVYWDDETCDDAEAYFKYNNGAYEHYVITAEKPESWESGSPDDSNGHEQDQNQENNSDNGDYNSNICEGDNCDISFGGFCNEPNVARTFKFLGLGFFVLKILVPAIIIIMGIVNLFKIITSGKEDEAKKYAKIVVRNVVIGIVIFLAPTLINFVYDTVKSAVSISDNNPAEKCIDCILDPLKCEVK